MKVEHLLTEVANVNNSYLELGTKWTAVVAGEKVYRTILAQSGLSISESTSTTGRGSQATDDKSMYICLAKTRRGGIKGKVSTENSPRLIGP